MNDFKEYADVLFNNFGDRVKTWITVNSPGEYCVPGYMNQSAPGVERPMDGPYICGHNMLLSHAEIYQLYKSKYAGQNGRIGMTILGTWAEPRIWAKDDDIEAAWRHLQFQFGWFAHPMFIDGDYPEVMKAMIAEKRAELGQNSDLPVFTPEEKNLLKGSADFIGLNYWDGFMAHTGSANQTCAYLCDQDHRLK